MAASYENTTYASDGGAVFKIRLSTDKYAALTVDTGGASTVDAYVKISKSKREFGLRPRGLLLSRVIGTAPNTFKKYDFLPMLTAAAMAGETVGETIQIGSITWTIADKVAESKTGRG